MASNRIKGITIEIEGNTTKLTESLKSVDKSLKSTEKELKDVDKLLKLDPNNVNLLRQKQQLLSKAVEDTKEKLQQEKDALEQLKNAPDADKTIDQQRALEREIADTTASLKQYQNELNHSGVALTQIGNTAQAVADKTRALSLAAAGFGAALLTNAYKSAQSADELATLSKQTGFTVEELQKMQYASEFVDVSFESMTGSIKKLTAKMGSGSAIFEELGISIYDANGNMRDATEVWYESLQALSQIENETERDAVSMELFGKSAMDMAGIVDDGGEALKEFGDEAEDMGIILDKEAVESANEFNDAMDKLKQTATASFKKAGATLATALLPALEKLGKVVNKALTWFANLNSTQQKTILVVVGLVAAISPVASIIATITKTIGTLKTAMTSLSSVFTAFTSPVGLVVAAIVALIAIGVLLYKNWDTIKAKATELWNSLKTTFNNIKTSIENAWNGVKNSVSNAVNNIKNTAVTAFNNLRSGVATVMSNLRDSVSSVFGSVRDYISNAVNNIRSTVSSVFSNIVYAMTHPFETARNTISGIIERIKGIFNFSWSLPHINLPHFRVQGGQFPYGLGGRGYLPSISVDWYAKAMRSGMILTSPTIFGMQNGRLLGAGESGSETVVGTSSLMEMIQSAVGNAPTVNVVVNANGMNPDELSSLVVDKITNQLKRTNQRW